MFWTLQYQAYECPFRPGLQPGQCILCGAWHRPPHPEHPGPLCQCVSADNCEGCKVIVIRFEKCKKYYFSFICPSLSVHTREMSPLVSQNSQNSQSISLDPDWPLATQLEVCSHNQTSFMPSIRRGNLIAAEIIGAKHSFLSD